LTVQFELAKDEVFARGKLGKIEKREANRFFDFKNRILAYEHNGDVRLLKERGISKNFPQKSNNFRLCFGDRQRLCLRVKFHRGPAVFRPEKDRSIMQPIRHILPELEALRG